MAPITSLYAALTALLVIALASLVVRGRWLHRVGLGTGGSPELERAVRVHANLVEYAPIGLILLLLLELAALPAWFLHGCGAAFFLSRLLHALGLSQRSGSSPGRYLGTLGTWLVIIVMAAVLLFRGMT